MYYCYNAFSSNNLNANVTCNITSLILLCCRKCLLHHSLSDTPLLNSPMFLRASYSCNKFIVAYEHNVNSLKMDLNF